MIVAERVAERMKALGFTQSSLARAAGVSQSLIGKIVNERAYGTTHLHTIATLLQTTPAYLTGKTDDPAEDAFVPPTPAEIASEMGLVRIVEIDLAIGMGGAFTDEDENHMQVVERWIPEEWVTNFTNTPAPQLAIARPTGDSMYPTINDRDMVLIDRSQRTIDRMDGIWVLVYGGFRTIRRVRVLPDGAHLLMGDNPQVRDQLATDGDLFVIGRVAGVFRRA